jgi:hypothetical protein
MGIALFRFSLGHPIDISQFPPILWWRAIQPRAETGAQHQGEQISTRCKDRVDAMADERVKNQIGISRALYTAYSERLASLEGNEISHIVSFVDLSQELKSEYQRCRKMTSGLEVCSVGAKEELKRILKDLSSLKQHCDSSRICTISRMKRRYKDLILKMEKSKIKAENADRKMSQALMEERRVTNTPLKGVDSTLQKILPFCKEPTNMSRENRAKEEELFQKSQLLRDRSRMAKSDFEECLRKCEEVKKECEGFENNNDEDEWVENDRSLASLQQRLSNKREKYLAFKEKYDKALEILSCLSTEDPMMHRD